MCLLLKSPNGIVGCGFQTKQRYRFGWFSMKLKLVGGDSAGVVTAYYVSWNRTKLFLLLEEESGMISE